MKLAFKDFKERHAFTLMELMIVLLIIGILMSGIFMLMSIADRNSDKAQTRAKIQKIQNAISGFYAAYGTYPPVDGQYANMDPFTSYDNDFDQQINGQGGLNSAEVQRACRWACRAQPMSFEFPCTQKMDAMINLIYQPVGARTPNEVFGNASTINKTDWADVKMFKFGLMSFLLPRIEMVGIPSTGSFNDNQPISGFYESDQWDLNNKDANVGGTSTLVDGLRAQGAIESRTVSKWLPNLEGMIACLDRTIMNVHLLDNSVDMHDIDLDPLPTGVIQNKSKVPLHELAFRGPYEYNGQKTMLVCATVKDNWDMDLFYYSAPPYQSYRLWSAGPDRKTFPPWIPLESLSTADREIVAGWLEDDIVGID